VQAAISEGKGGEDGGGGGGGGVQATISCGGVAGAREGEEEERCGEAGVREEEEQQEGTLSRRDVQGVQVGMRKRAAAASALVRLGLLEEGGGAPCMPVHAHELGKRWSRRSRMSPGFE